MPRRGWALPILATALVTGTLAIAPPALADEGPVRTITNGATVVDATFDGQKVLLQGDDLEVADAFAGTTTPVPGTTGATALGLDSRGDQWVLWRRGAELVARDLRMSTDRPMSIPADATVLGVGHTTSTVLLAVGTRYWLVDPQAGITDLLPEGATDPMLSADGNEVWFVLGDGLYHKDRNYDPTRRATVEPDERLDAVSSDGDLAALVDGEGFRMVTTWPFPDRVVTTGSPTHVVGLTAYADPGVTYTTRAPGEPARLQQWYFDGHSEVVGVDEAGEPLAVDGPIQVSRDTSTVTFQVGATLWAHDRVSGTSWVLQEGGPFPAVVLGRSGGQIAWTDGAQTSERWDRPVPRLTASGLNTYEGSAGSWTTVELEAPQHGTTRLRYESVGADPSADLTGTSGVVEVPEGQRFVQVPFGIIDDHVREGEETFKLRFTWDDGRPGEAIATITIQDDDDKPYLNAWFASAVEHDGQITWNVTLDRPWDQPVTVDWSAVEQWTPTARAGVDFVPASGTVTFAPGQTSVPVSVPIIDDTEVESTEYFSLLLSSAAVHYGGTSSLGTIYDDDVTPPVVSVADAHADERSGAMTWVVSLDRPTAKDVTVAWRAFTDTSAPSDRRAADGKDFRSANGVVTIPAGATQATVSAQVLDDLFVERDEWFVVELSSPTHAALGRTKATGTINDDESATLWSAPPQLRRLLPA